MDAVYFFFIAVKKIRTDSLYINNLEEMDLDLAGYVHLHGEGTSKRSKVRSLNT